MNLKIAAKVSAAVAVVIYVGYLGFWIGVTPADRKLTPISFGVFSVLGAVALTPIAMRLRERDVKKEAVTGRAYRGGYHVVQQHSRRDRVESSNDPTEQLNPRSRFGEGPEPTVPTRAQQRGWPNADEITGMTRGLLAQDQDTGDHPPV